MKQHRTGKLLVLLPGLGAVATTTIAGVELSRRGLGAPVGSLTQLDHVTLPSGPVPIREALPLAELGDVVFGAWDIVSDDAATVAERCGVLSTPHLDQVREMLAGIRPRPGVHDPERCRRIQADHVADVTGHREAIARLRADIREMMAEAGAARAVVVHTASTETHQPAPPAAASLEALEDALDRDDPGVTPTMLYAYAALSERVPFANATPNAAVELPAFRQLSYELGVPIAGRDLKTGQTLIKTALAPAIRSRMLGLNGWFSTNILGNRDGEVLDDPDAFRSKELTKTGVLETILPAQAHPELYGHYDHKVSIHYYPPRGDEKEGWDNIDLFGWMGYRMQIKVNFLCRDSILAAPLVLDLALFLDAAHRLGRRGVQDWLSFYFKSPAPPPGGRPEHDLFAQLELLRATVRELADDAAAEREAPDPVRPLSIHAEVG